MKVIEVDNLTKDYGSRRGVFDDKASHGVFAPRQRQDDHFQ